MKGKRKKHNSEIPKSDMVCPLWAHAYRHKSDEAIHHQDERFEG